VTREVLRHKEFDGRVKLGRVRDHYLCTDLASPNSTVVVWSSFSDASSATSFVYEISLLSVAFHRFQVDQHVLASA
jgi:hypothetical protein